MATQFGLRSVDLSFPKVMGILNVTPDSFSDGGSVFRGAKLDVSLALSRAQAMVQEGATFIDVGGESTRPGALPVSLGEEMDRVLPVVEAISRNVDCVISVDTSSPEVITAASNLGAGLINDVRALTREGAIEAVAVSGLPVCLMHMNGMPVTMQDAPVYESVVDEIIGFFQERIQACCSLGIPADNILLDPGIGFGKTDEHNVKLLASLSKFSRLGIGHDVLIGVSRKSLIGRLLKRDVDERLAGSLAFGYDALIRGAKILRVHDVKETFDAVRVFELMHPLNS